MFLQSEAKERVDLFSHLIAKILMHLQLVLNGRSEDAAAHFAVRPGGPTEDSPGRQPWVPSAPTPFPTLPRGGRERGWRWVVNPRLPPWAKICRSSGAKFLN